MNVNVEGTLIKTLGIEIRKIDEESVVATMPVDERTRQPFGILHGGASVALAETVASIGAYTSINAEKEIAVGLEINANHIKAKKDGVVTAIAKPVHRGRSTMVWEIQIVDEQNDLICLSRCTMAIMPKKPVHT
ncbi:hotdog fold thioesterase [Bacillus sp. FJAT-47783]|uniref:hotdog fold thioesterase n=1 Tax=Bacillus sp. FJAT-47783 TaxID=2922712 RepID=UPI001FAD4EDB|nr:hotdog fold thioesterase [Bacillus sp. FJAT-47783]